MNASSRAVALLLLLGNGQAWAQALATTAFVDVAVVPMDRPRVLAHQTVVVQGDHIVAMGPVKQVAIPAGAARVQGRGKFLIPGLADMHAHLEMRWPVELDTITVTPSLLQPSMHALTRFVASGVTTIRDMWGTPLSLAVKKQVASGAVLGPRIYLSVRPEEQGLWHLSKRPAEAVRLAKQAGFDFLKFWGAPTGEELDSIQVAARQVSMPIAGHPPDQVDNLLAIKEGYRSVEHLLGFWHKEDTTKLSATAPLFKQAGVWVCPTLAHISGPFGVPSGDTATDKAKLYHATKMLYDAGVGLLAGTDAMLGPRPGYFVTDELATLAAAGLPPYAALATATRNPALYFGTADSVGTVAVGKRADLVLLSGNPLTNIRNVSRQAGVMVRGRWLSRHALDSLVAQLPK